MLVNHFGELRSGGGSLVIVLCTCNERLHNPLTVRLVRSISVLCALVKVASEYSTHGPYCDTQHQATKVSDY